MKQLLKTEELMMTVGAITYLHYHDHGWNLFCWIFLFLLPDIGMLGYLMNNKTGAYSYNLFHHKGIAILIWIVGYFANYDGWQMVGAILFGHASFDRMMGYGLKYIRGFHFTHLGNLKKKD